MFEFKEKIKNRWIKYVLSTFLFLIVFIVLFYLSNWDFKKTFHASSVQEVSLNAGDEKELQNRLGLHTLSFLDYDSWAKQNNLGEGTDKYDGDPDNDGSRNFWEYAQNTDPNNSDTDKDGYSDRQEVMNGYDPDAYGDVRLAVEIIIEKINVSVPMVWTKSEEEKLVMEDLKSGVAHLFKTAAPGQNGNMLISGHSSNYIWAKGNYNYIFKDLDNLENGDLITVKTIQKNGRIITYHYVVNDKFITGPDDEIIFKDTAEPSLTLSTCWPLGTAFRRLIVKAELIK
jgi:LPXTG-site transpeptidase (sortase) family protein